MAVSVVWRKHIEAWQSSGLSQAAYCRERGLNPNTFSSRLHHYRTVTASAVPALIPVQVESKPAACGGIVLRHAQGHRLEISATVSPRWLAELLQCLG